MIWLILVVVLVRVDDTVLMSHSLLIRCCLKGWLTFMLLFFLFFKFYLLLFGNDLVGDDLVGDDLVGDEHVGMTLTAMTLSEITVLLADANISIC